MGADDSHQILSRIVGERGMHGHVKRIIRSQAEENDRPDSEQKKSQYLAFTIRPESGQRLHSSVTLP